jgi:hypothetical protein
MESEKVVAALVATLMTGLPAQASALARDTRAPNIVHVKVLQTPSGEPVVIRARFEDRSEIFAPSVYYRQHGKAEYRTIEMKKGAEGWEAVIPAEVVTRALEYFIEVFDSEGNGPAREGTPEKPIPIAVYEDKRPPTPPIGTDPLPPPPAPPPPPPPDLGITNPPPPPHEDDGIADKWWFWTGIGVAVTGGIVAAVLLTQGSDPVPAVTVEVVGPDPTAGVP